MTNPVWKRVCPAHCNGASFTQTWTVGVCDPEMSWQRRPDPGWGVSCSPRSLDEISQLLLFLPVDPPTPPYWHPSKTERLGKDHEKGSNYCPKWFSVNFYIGHFEHFLKLNMELLELSESGVCLLILTLFHFSCHLMHAASTFSLMLLSFAE